MKPKQMVNIPITSYTFPNGTHPVVSVCPYPDGDALISFFNFELHREWPDIGALFGFYVVFVLLSIFAITRKKL